MRLTSEMIMDLMGRDDAKAFHARLFGYNKPSEGGTLCRELVSGLLFTDGDEGLFPDNKINLIDCMVIVVPKGPLKEAVRQGASIEDLITLLGNKDEWRDKP
jgi:hypothetical protein